MPQHEGHDITRGTTTAALWFGILTGPILVLVMEELEYMTTPVVCVHRDNPFWGALLHAIAIACLLVTIGAGVTAWRCRKVSQPTQRTVIPDNRMSPDNTDDAGAPNGRIHFMAQVGLWLSGLSLLVLIGEWIPIFMLSPCGRG